MEKAIYKIVNQINGKVYIGQSVHPDRRWIEHKHHARKQIDNYPIHLAINKYGEENFTFEILEWTENYNTREQQLIKEYGSLAPNGYNVGEGGENYVMYGEDNPRNIIKEANVLLIIEDLKENILTDKAIAKKYNVTDKIVADINHGYTHKQVGENYPIRIKHGSQKLSLDEVQEIKYILATSLTSYQELANKYDVSKSSIYSINKGETYHDENITYPIRSQHRKN